MFALICTVYFLGAIPMYALIDKFHQSKQDELYRERLKEQEEERNDPKYNLPRQKEVVEMCMKPGHAEEIQEIIGKKMYFDIIIKYQYAELKHSCFALIKAIAEKEGWEVYYDPVCTWNIYGW